MEIGSRFMIYVNCIIIYDFVLHKTYGEIIIYFVVMTYVFKYILLYPEHMLNYNFICWDGVVLPYDCFLFECEEQLTALK